MKITSNKPSQASPAESKELVVQTPSLRLAAKCWGNIGSRPPILAFHGWLDNAATFDHLAPFLKEFHLVSLDLPGHGFSDHRPSGSSYHFIDLIVDMLEVINFFGWDRFSLLGHSMGAGVASYLAGTIPEKIESVILIEGLGSITQRGEKMPEIFREASKQWMEISGKKLPVYNDFESAVKVRHSVGGIRENSVRTLVDRGLRPVDGGFTWRSDPRLKIRSRHYLTEEQSCAFLREITAPVLLIEAENTQRDEWKKLYIKRIPYVKNLRHCIVSGDHHLHLDNPEDVSAIILKFLKDI